MKEIFDIKRHIKSDPWPVDEIKKQLEALGTSPESKTDKAVLVILHDEALAGLYLDTTSGHEVITSAPWRGAEHISRFWTDDDSKSLARYCSEKFHFRPSVGAVDEAIRSVLYDSREGRMVNPWRAYLEDCRGTWDGVERFGPILERVLGIPASAYSITLLERWLIGAVQRAFEPGSKMDGVLTLYGPQGGGKGSFLSLLPPDAGLYADLDFSRFAKVKDIGEDLVGKAVIELGEMRGLRKASQGDVKSGLTRQSDRYRAAYGKRSEDHPRTCVFACTVNPKTGGGILTDLTGNRRYWPLQAPGAGLSYDEIKAIMDSQRDQIWAEAVVCYDRGTLPVLPEEIEAQAEKLRRELLDVDHGMVDTITDYLHMSLRGGSSDQTRWAGQDAWYRMTPEMQKQHWTKYRTQCLAADTGDGREYVCMEELWRVALDGDRKPSRMESQQLMALFSSGQIEGWEYSGDERKPCGQYGRQRVAVRRKPEPLPPWIDYEKCS